jgi:DNA-binding response OmpR family regulator
VAYDGDEGLYEALSGIHDIILLDIMLPGVDGIEIIRRIREEGIRTPVIFTTALGSVSDRVKGLDAGADDYLPKPFSTRELLARIRAVARRKTGNSDMQGRPGAGNVRYDSGELIAFVGGREVKLTPREGQLLELFLINAGNVLSKERIFDRIWGIDNDMNPSIIEIYVHRLRKKVASGESGIRIKTVRGVGYRLKAT